MKKMHLLLCITLLSASSLHATATFPTNLFAQATEAIDEEKAIDNLNRYTQRLKALKINMRNALEKYPTMPAKIYKLYAVKITEIANDVAVGLKKGTDAGFEEVTEIKKQTLLKSLPFPRFTQKMYSVLFTFSETLYDTYKDFTSKSFARSISEKDSPDYKKILSYRATMRRAVRPVFTLEKGKMMRTLSDNGEKGNMALYDQMLKTLTATKTTTIKTKSTQPFGSYFHTKLKLTQKHALGYLKKYTTFITKVPGFVLSQASKAQPEQAVLLSYLNKLEIVVKDLMYGIQRGTDGGFEKVREGIEFARFAPEMYPALLNFIITLDSTIVQGSATAKTHLLGLRNLARILGEQDESITNTYKDKSVLLATPASVKVQLAAGKLQKSIQYLINMTFERMIRTLNDYGKTDAKIQFNRLQQFYNQSTPVVKLWSAQPENGSEQPYEGGYLVNHINFTDAFESGRVTTSQGAVRQVETYTLMAAAEKKGGSKIMLLNNIVADMQVGFGTDASHKFIKQDAGKILYSLDLAIALLTFLRTSESEIREAVLLHGAAPKNQEMLKQIAENFKTLITQISVGLKNSMRTFKEELKTRMDLKLITWMAKLWSKGGELVSYVLSKRPSSAA